MQLFILVILAICPHSYSNKTVGGEHCQKFIIQDGFKERQGYCLFIYYTKGCKLSLMSEPTQLMLTDQELLAADIKERCDKEEFIEMMLRRILPLAATTTSTTTFTRPAFKTTRPATRTSTATIAATTSSKPTTTTSTTSTTTTTTTPTTTTSPTTTTTTSSTTTTTTPTTTITPKTTSKSTTSTRSTTTTTTFTSTKSTSATATSTRAIMTTTTTSKATTFLRTTRGGSTETEIITKDEQLNITETGEHSQTTPGGEAKYKDFLKREEEIILKHWTLRLLLIVAVMTVVLILQLAVIKQMRAHWRPQQPPLPHPKIGASVLHPTTTTTSSVSSTIEKKQGKTKKTKAKKMTKRKERRKGTRKKADGKKKKKAVSTSHRSLDTTEAGTVDLYTSPFGAKIKLDKTMTDSMASPAGGRSKATGDTKSKEKESSKDSSKGDEQADESTSNLYIRRK